MREAHRGVRAAPHRRRLLPALKPLLLLWDIDGTLLRRASEAHAAALIRGVIDVHRVDVHGLGVDAAGRTDRAIVRLLLAAKGVGAAAVDDRWEDVLAATCAVYDELCPRDLSATVSPGIPALLDELGARDDEFRHSLVTGNFERVARLKLARAGIGRHFAAGQGAFGSDAEAREDLPPIARERAGGWPRERTVVIGDTPHDIACARADGLRVIGIATGPCPAAALESADAVVEEVEGLAPVLEEMLRLA